MSKADILFQQYNKQYKEELLTRGTVTHQCQRINFSSPRANYMLYGGIPRGRLIEFAGEENGGKTTTALDITGNAQKLFKQEWEDRIAELEAIDKPNKTQAAELLELRETGPKKVLWVDCENTFDDEWAGQLGVVVDELYFMSPQSQSAEQIFEIVINLIETGEFGLVVIDSYGSMMSQQAYDKTLEDKTYGGIASALTQFSKKAEMFCAKTNCALIGINQLRENMNSMHGGTTTPGGKAWKHHCSVRLSFRKGDHFDEKYTKVAKSTYENPYGHNVMINIEKTKICKPNRKLGSYTLEYDNGINYLMDYADLGINCGVIKQSGAWFTFIDPYTGEIMCDEDSETYKVQGQRNLPEFLRTHEKLFSVIKDYVDRLITGEV